MSFLEFSDSVLDWSLSIALAMLGVAFVLTITRIYKGPTLPDRVLGLDLLTASSIGFIAIIGIDTGFTLYVDVAIALGLVGFLATVSFARFIMVRGDTERSPVQETQETEQRHIRKPIGNHEVLR
ncbi:cation:proton antiporter [Aureimonas fodinaquatilis]|uniref:Cation:proton antiporter n=1 Tax=Aureimonas fodinaquatilis TaxID=2565783 RepID=A0A5B0E106_9HYPH|nr:cation:proton antiporter [Aureimonas fodinaquatilis]KAA0972308.1 cation:proton antiporter [Aureimonas fodinaquatilis]